MNILRDYGTAKQLRTYLVLSFLMFIGICLGLYHLDYQSIWLDEYTTLNVSQSYETIMEFCRVFPEQHPLYYFLIYLFKANTGLYELRLFSLIFGIASIIPLYYIGRKLFSPAVALLGSLLFSVSPFILYYNQEGRMYTLLMFLALVQVSFFISWVKEKKRTGKAGFIVFSVLALYTHFFALFLLAAELIFLWAVHMVGEKEIGLKRLSVVFGTIGLSYIPWLIFMVMNVGSNAQDWKGVNHILLAIPYFFFRFVLGYAVFPLNSDVKMNFMDHIPGALLWFLVACIAYAPTAFLFGKQRGQLTKFQKVIPLLALLPVCLAVVASLFKNMISERYVIYSLPFLFLLVASVSCEAFAKRRILSFLSFLLPLCLSVLGLLFYYFNAEFGKTDYKAASFFIREVLQKDDVVLCKPGFIEGPLDYYLKGTHPIDSYESWKTNHSGDEVWVLEQIVGMNPPVSLVDLGYEQVKKKVWPKETGLRLTQWCVK